MRLGWVGDKKNYTAPTQVPSISSPNLIRLVISNRESANEETASREEFKRPNKEGVKCSTSNFEHVSLSPSRANVSLGAQIKLDDWAIREEQDNRVLEENSHVRKSGNSFAFVQYLKFERDLLG